MQERLEREVPVTGGAGAADNGDSLRRRVNYVGRGVHWRQRTKCWDKYPDPATVEYHKHGFYIRWLLISLFAHME